MIQAGQVSGARALQDLQRNSDYLKSRQPKIWTQEYFQQLLADPTLLNRLDASTAVEASSQMMLELNDLFTILRDSKYQSRSRRWLYTKAYHTKQLQGYETWRAFAIENQTADLPGLFLNVQPDSLSGKPYTDLLALDTNSTKLQKAQALLQKQGD